MYGRSACSSQSNFGPAARAELGEAISWARSIGARNFEAGFVENSAQSEVLFGDPQAAYELATKAEALAADVHMSFIEAQAVLHQARAGILGASTASHPAEYLRKILRSAHESGSAVRAVYALNTAARLLADEEVLEIAALAESVNRMHAAMEVRLDEETREAASARIRDEGLDVLDVIGLVLPALDRLLPAPR